MPDTEPLDTAPLDALILGDGPVSLIEAVLRARHGHRIAVVEHNAQPGGCWQSTELDEIKHIEGACHLLENYRGTYEFLDRLGLTTHVCEPQPEVLTAAGQRFAYNARGRTLSRIASVAFRLAAVTPIRGLERVTGVRIRRTAKFRMGEGWQALRAYLRHPMFGPDADRAIRYLDGGSPRMLAVLRDELFRHEVPIHHARAAHVDLTGPHVRVQLTNGTTLDTHRLIATESAVLDSIRTHRETLSFTRQEQDHHHLVLEVRGLPHAIVSYVQLTGDPLVARLSDVTAFCSNPPEDGRRILVVQLYGWQPDAPHEPVVAHLKSRGLLPENVTVTRARTTTIRTGSTSPDLAAAIRRLHRDDLTVLPSRGDLCLAIARNRARWESFDERYAKGDDAPNEAIVPASLLTGARVTTR